MKTSKKTKLTTQTDQPVTELDRLQSIALRAKIDWMDAETRWNHAECEVLKEQARLDAEKGTGLRAAIMRAAECFAVKQPLHG
jgi:hypothetical protein